MLPIFLLLIASPTAISDPTAQERVENLIRAFLSQFQPYMALYFSNLDTAYTRLGDETFFKELNEKMTSYQDSTMMFLKSDPARSNAYYDIYKKLTAKKDSIAQHYKPRAMGYLIIHHFELGGDPWTDSFMVDFKIQHILKIKETIE